MLNLSFHGHVEQENKVRVLVKLSNLLQVVALKLNKKFLKVAAVEKQPNNYEVFFEEDGLPGRIKTFLKLNKGHDQIVSTTLDLIEEKNPSDIVMRHLVEDFLQACYETEGIELKTKERTLLIKENYLLKHA